jgi:hypothetical protein
VSVRRPLLSPLGSQAVLAECDLRTSAQAVGLPLRSGQRNVKLHRANGVVWRSLRRDSGVDGVRAERPRQKRPLWPHRAVLRREQPWIARSCALVVVLPAAVANVPRQPPKSGRAVILCAEKGGSRQTNSHDDYHQQDCERDPIQKAVRPFAQGGLGSQPDRVIDAPDPIHRSIVGLDTPELVDLRRQGHELTGLGRILAPPESEPDRRTVALPTFVFHALEPPPPGLRGSAGRILRLRSTHRAPPSAGRICRTLGRLPCAVDRIEGVPPHDLWHHAATVIARNPNVTLWELTATIRHSSHVAALRYHRLTADRSEEIAAYLDGVISAATAPNRRSPSASVRDGCGMGVAWSEEPRNDGSEKRASKQGHQLEAAGGIEPPYGALQAPA